MTYIDLEMGAKDTKNQKLDSVKRVVNGENPPRTIVSDDVSSVKPRGTVDEVSRARTAVFSSFFSSLDIMYFNFCWNQLVTRHPVINSFLFIIYL